MFALLHSVETDIHRSLAETACGITCGCLPVCPAFFKHIIPICTDSASQIFGNLNYKTTTRRSPWTQSDSEKHRNASSLRESSKTDRLRIQGNYSELTELRILPEPRIAVGYAGNINDFHGAGAHAGPSPNEANHPVPPNKIMKSIHVEQWS